jgi:hypothetical protein
MTVNGGRINQQSGENNAFLVESGSLSIYNTEFRHDAGLARTAAEVKVVGASNFLRMIGNTFHTASGTSGPALAIDTDHVDNYIVSNNFRNFSVVFPTTITNGEYGPNTIINPAAEPTVSFSTNGNFIPTYVSRDTTWSFSGDGVISFTTVVRFNTNGYTTAAGIFQINTGIPVLPLVQTPVTIGHFEFVTFDETKSQFAEITPAGAIVLRSVSSGGALGNLGTAAIPASTNDITLRISGTYKYRE